MIGTLDTKNRSATIVGAGISGLLIGSFLKKKGYQVRIYEASDRAGGLIQTLRTESGLIETAAHSLMVTPEVQAFLNELGVELSPVHPESKARFIYRNGKMRRFPLTISEAFHTLFKFFSKPSTPIDPEMATLAEWCEAYLGKPALQYLLAPFVTGIFAATPEALHLKSAFPKLVPQHPDRSFFYNLWNRKRKKSNRPVMMAPTFGMEDLVDRLKNQLKDELILNHPLHSIPTAPNLILTPPAPELADLLSTIDPVSSAMLKKIHYAPLVTCTVFLKTESFIYGPPRGVGVLIPRNEGLRILGVLFNSSAFPKRSTVKDLHSFTVMLGGTEDPGAVDLSTTELTEIVNRELSRLLNLKSDPCELHLTHWKRAIPVYSKELSQAQAALKRGFGSIPGRMIFSNFSKEVSIRGLIQSLFDL